MPRQTDNLGLILPLGSKYWNLDTWVTNMKILDEAFTEIQGQIEERLTARNLTFDNTDLPLDATTVQDAIEELNVKSSSFRIIDVDENMTIPVSCTAHDYIILNFYNSVPNINFVKSDDSYQGDFQWLNGYPTFEANATYEISFLQLAGIWMKQEGIDWSRFFNFYIEDDIFYITSIKTDIWYDYFDNYDFRIPAVIDGMPVVIDNR